jgi:hypothetical protein
MNKGKQSEFLKNVLNMLENKMGQNCSGKRLNFIHIVKSILHQNFERQVKTSKPNPFT